MEHRCVATCNIKYGIRRIAVIPVGRPVAEPKHMDGVVVEACDDSTEWFSSWRDAMRPCMQLGRCRGDKHR